MAMLGTCALCCERLFTETFEDPRRRLTLFLPPRILTQRMFLSTRFAQLRGFPSAAILSEDDYDYCD